MIAVLLAKLAKVRPLTYAKYQSDQKKRNIIKQIFIITYKIG